MMHVVTFLAALVAAQVAWAGTAPLLGEHEAPRATDLLRAKRLSERTQSRLRLPHAPGRGWQHGGEGWNAPRKPSDREPRVIVNVGPTRQRRSKPAPVLD